MSLVRWLGELAGFGGPTTRWGNELIMPVVATDPADRFLGEQVAVMASVSLPAPMAMNFRWGAFTTNLPAVQGWTKFLSVAAGGIQEARHHDYLRVLLEWGVPNAVKMRTWVGPNHVFRFSAQQVTARLHRMTRLPDEVRVRAMLALGDSETEDKEKVLLSHTQTFFHDGAIAPFRAVGNNYARRGGYVTYRPEVGGNGWVWFRDSFVAPFVATGIVLTPASYLPIPLQWCGPIYAQSDDNLNGGTFTVTEFVQQPPEAAGWSDHL
jgi:hypothetical protein